MLNSAKELRKELDKYVQVNSVCYFLQSIL